MTARDSENGAVEQARSNGSRLDYGRSFCLSKSVYAGPAILATSAQFASVLVVRVSEDAHNYQVTVDLVDERGSLDRVLADFLRELTAQQARLDVEQRFGVTRDGLVKAAFEYSGDV